MPTHFPSCPANKLWKLLNCVPCKVRFQDFPYRNCPNQIALRPTFGLRTTSWETLCKSRVLIDRWLRSHLGCPKAFVSISILNTEILIRWTYWLRKRFISQRGSRKRSGARFETVLQQESSKMTSDLCSEDRLSSQLSESQTETELLPKTMFTSPVEAAVELGLTLIPKTTRSKIWNATHRTLIRVLECNKTEGNVFDLISCWKSRLLD